MKGQYVGVGGVAFHDDSIRGLFKMFGHTMESLGIPAPEELKWSPAKRSWVWENLVEDKRVEAYSAALNLLKTFDGTSIVSVVRRDMTSFDIARAKWESLRFVTERFQMFLQAQEDNDGIVIADFPGSGKDEKRLLADYDEFRGKGTDYVRPANIVMNLLTTESHLNPGLQLADLVVGSATCMCTPQNERASRLWHLVKSTLYRSKDGYVPGCGLKVFPQEWANETYQRLFAEFSDQDDYEAARLEREHERYLYSQVMSEDELNMHFPEF